MPYHGIRTDYSVPPNGHPWANHDILPKPSPFTDTDRSDPRNSLIPNRDYPRLVAVIVIGNIHVLGNQDLGFHNYTLHSRNRARSRNRYLVPQN